MRSRPTGPSLVGPDNIYGAAPDSCSPFGLAAGLERRTVLCLTVPGSETDLQRPNVDRKRPPRFAS